MICTMCKKIATGACPRCDKPLCASHSEPHVATRAEPVYFPGKDCRVPLHE